MSPLKLHWNNLDFQPVGRDLNPLYGEKSWNVFLKKRNLFATEERKTQTDWMTWGWVNYQDIFILKVNESFNKNIFNYLVHIKSLSYNRLQTLF